MKPYFKSIVYIILSMTFSPLTMAQEELNVYSARKEAYIKPLLDQFASAHNVTVNLVTSKADALIERLVNEGKNTPADVLITVDAGRLSCVVEHWLPPASSIQETCDMERLWTEISLDVLREKLPTSGTTHG